MFCLSHGQNEEIRTHKYALWGEVSNRNVGIGFQYKLDERWHIPLVVGICNEFNERKWNDWYIDLQPYYLLGKRKVQFPVGAVGGVRLMNDYENYFSSWFYGLYGGGLYRNKHHGLGLNIGVKFGKKYHLLKNAESWGMVEVYETYQERPFFFSVRYQFEF